MDNTYQATLQWLISERNVTDTKDYECAANAIVQHNENIPNALSGISEHRN